MNIGELFVRVTGDTSDFTNKMGGAQRTLGNFGKSAEEAHGGVGRLNNAMAGMATQIAGINPVMGKATEIIASLGLGSASVVTGALAGLALLAYAWDTLTKSAREAGKAQDDAIKRLAKMAQMKGAGPGGQIALDLGEANAKLLKLQETRSKLIQGFTNDPLGIAPGQEAMLEDLDEQIESTKNLIRLGSQWNKEAIAGAAGHSAAIKEVVGKYNELRDAAEKVNASMMQEKKDWWHNYIEATNEALTLTEQLNNAINAARPDLVDSLKSVLTAPDTSAAGNVDEAVKAYREGTGKDLEAQARHSQDVQNAIWGAAIQSSQIIVNALNIGGGGRGSSLGGSIGSTIGFGLGFAATSFFGGGPVGGAIGSLIGNVAGSLFGGLFDHHKKAVDQNTQAVRALTNALLQNAPSGFKIASARYAASDPKSIMSDFAAYRTRGGTVRLGT